MDQNSYRIIAALKAARAALNWSQVDLARVSSVSLVTVARTEAGLMSPRLSTLSKLKAAVENSGVRIIEQDPEGGFTLKVEGRALRSGLRKVEEQGKKTA